MVCLKIGGCWKPNIQWSFLEDKDIAISLKWEDIFARSVINAWKNVSLDLVKILRKLESEFYRQPLIWNSWLTDQRGQMMGRRTRCAWA